MGACWAWAGSTLAQTPTAASAVTRVRLEWEKTAMNVSSIETKKGDVFCENYNHNLVTFQTTHHEFFPVGLEPR